MNSLVHIKSEFPCMYMLNGNFTEKADSFNYNTDNPIYITAFPLQAHLLPYTVKIVGGKPLYNAQLCSSFAPEGHLYIKLKPRYNYVYSVQAEKDNIEHFGCAENFFNAVKRGDINFARTLLSADLNESVDDESLQSFFDDYTAIFKNDFGNKTAKNEYFLIEKGGNGIAFNFEIENGLINNISEN